MGRPKAGKKRYWVSITKEEERILELLKKKYNLRYKGDALRFVLKFGFE